MPKGNQVPGLPINDEASRQFICAHVFDTLDTATRNMSIEEAGKLGEALCEEIDHVASMIERERRWVKLVTLLSKLGNGGALPTTQESQTIIALWKRQGLDESLLSS